jgi:hypothetical protein
MKRYLIAGAVAGTLAATAAFAIQPGTATTRQDPLTAPLDYQNTMREWSTGLGFDVADAIGAASQPSEPTYQVARLEQAYDSVRGYHQDQDDDRDQDEDGDEAEEGPNTQ